MFCLQFKQNKKIQNVANNVYTHIACFGLDNYFENVVESNAKT